MLDSGQVVVMKDGRVRPQQRPDSAASETEYSEDSQGQIKVSPNGEPIKHFEIDSDTGKIKHDHKGKPIVKRRNPTNLKNSERIQPMRTLRGNQAQRSDSSETVYSVDSQTG